MEPKEYEKNVINDKALKRKTSYDLYIF